LEDLGAEMKINSAWEMIISEINRDNLNNVRHEANRYFGNKMREYVKE
jgi:hypothetical protein